jgi:hypothetical protein
VLTLRPTPVLRRALLLLALCASVAPAARAQQADAEAVLTVIDQLFDGMRSKDTASMRALFVPGARMLGLGRDGQVRADGIDGWLASIGRSPAAQVLRERTWNHDIKVDGAVAQAWMDYDFWVGERFSHCGIDGFQLLKVGTNWKIASVVDTRRTEGCTEPPPSRR